MEAEYADPHNQDVTPCCAVKPELSVMASQHVHHLCHQSSVSQELARNPCDVPADVIKRLYHDKKPRASLEDEGKQDERAQSALDIAYECGSWPRNRPSRLFLQAFSDALACLESDPMASVVSPPLMGSSGIIPLTIISPLVGIVRHCAQLIQQARREVVFITCTWKPSKAQRIIREALLELSRQAGQRRERVKVRIMLGLPEIRHFLDSHQLIHPATYASKHIQLPLPREVPYIDLEVMAVHGVFLGTLHSKLLVVDGVAAAVMSNNIEDNANLEMLIHLEGPIVKSIYDTAIVTWGKEFSQNCSENLQNPWSNVDLQGEIARENKDYESSARENLTALGAVNRQLNLSTKFPIDPTGPPIAEGSEMLPYIPCMTARPMPMALVSRPPYGHLDSGNTNVPQNEAWLSLVRNARRSIFIQTPDLNVDSLVEELSKALRRGVEVTYYVCFGYNDAGEMIPGQGGTNEQAARRLLASISGDKQARKLLNIHYYVAKDQDHPIHHSFKTRSCHIKLLIADESVGVQGSGNQDTQSWCHSQEVNVMVDSPEICTKWRWAIEQNQNTAHFGRVYGDDGIWRDAKGEPGPGYSGDPGMVGGLVKGVIGMAKKAAA